MLVGIRQQAETVALEAEHGVAGSGMSLQPR